MARGVGSRAKSARPNLRIQGSDSSRIAMPAHWSTAKTHHQLWRGRAAAQNRPPVPAGATEPCAIFLLLTLLRDRRVTRLWTTPFRISVRYPILAAAHLSRPHIPQLTTTFSSSFTGTILILDERVTPS